MKLGNVLKLKRHGKSGHLPVERVFQLGAPLGGTGAGVAADAATAARHPRVLHARREQKGLTTGDFILYTT